MRTYLMYNHNGHMFDDDIVIEAESGATACREFLKRLNIPFSTVKRSASNRVTIKAAPFIAKDGQRFRDGKGSWFEVIA